MTKPDTIAPALKEAVFQLTVEVAFADNGVDVLEDQAWDALRELLPMELDYDARLIGDVLDRKP